MRDKITDTCITILVIAFVVWCVVIIYLGVC